MSNPTPHQPLAPVTDARDPAPPAPLPAALESDAAPPPRPYDPADYRWVPVRRRPRYDGWTEEKQRRFIETLADTGLVNVAARAVGMTRESAYRLRRAGHAAAFARAWDAARHHAGGLIEDIAFERAIEGTETEVLDREGNLVATKLVHDNRLLQYLLRHLKPERYGSGRAPAAGEPPTTAPESPPIPALEETLRAMEPTLPAPPEQMLDAETLADELQLADIVDGKLPHFLTEQSPPKTDAQLAAEEAAARHARGEAAWEKLQGAGQLSHAEYADLCSLLDPQVNARPPRTRRDANMPTV